eukprot:m.150816 g.150816  ORF g.150816 m.150816 type:complete len:239 (-) comp10147_c1_seq1:76-792(-)
MFVWAVIIEVKMPNQQHPRDFRHQLRDLLQQLRAAAGAAARWILRGTIFAHASPRQQQLTQQQMQQIMDIIPELLDRGYADINGARPGHDWIARLADVVTVVQSGPILLNTPCCICQLDRTLSFTITMHNGAKLRCGSVCGQAIVLALRLLALLALGQPSRHIERDARAFLEQSRSDRAVLRAGADGWKGANSEHKACKSTCCSYIVQRVSVGSLPLLGGGKCLCALGGSLWSRSTAR